MLTPRSHRYAVRRLKASGSNSSHVSASLAIEHLEDRQLLTADMVLQWNDVLLGRRANRQDLASGRSASHGDCSHGHFRYG